MNGAVSCGNFRKTIEGWNSGNTGKWLEHLMEADETCRSDTPVKMSRLTGAEEQSFRIT